MKKRLIEFNKKAQDLSIGTLILIVLGVIVLVLLILGFSLGWSNLWEKINIFGGSSSIGDVVTACKIAVTSQDKYSYCQDFKRIKVDGKTEYVSCEDQRVATSIDTKITCDKPTDYNTWAGYYCNKVLSADERSKAKVNNAQCAATS
ncbi:hypothetical protein HYV50_01135 [Candidatus Pacearchaeota archaeon]|nr:hypothetical protein [Candidatus Pacearchaeota archaeon]